MSQFKYIGDLAPQKDGKVRIKYPRYKFSIAVAPNETFEVPSEDTELIDWLKEVKSPFTKVPLYQFLG